MLLVSTEFFFNCANIYQILTVNAFSAILKQHFKDFVGVKQYVCHRSFNVATSNVNVNHSKAREAKYASKINAISQNNDGRETCN
jgi:hypothetical protein